MPRVVGQPRLIAGRLSLRPWHGRACTVALQALRVEAHSFAVAQAVARHVGMWQAEFITLIDQKVSAQAHQDRDQQFS